MPKGETGNADWATTKEQLFEGEVPNHLKVVGIKRPTLLCGRCGEFKQLNQGAKLIAVLRDPIDRLISAYHHYMRTGLLPVLPINVGLPDILEHRMEHWPRSNEVIEFGRYASGLSRYDDVLVLTHQELIDDTQQAMDRIYELLSLRRVFIEFNGNSPQAGIYSLERIRFELILKSVRYSEYSRGGVTQGINLSESDKTFIEAMYWFDREILSPRFGNKKPTLDPDLEEKLKKIYKDEALAVTRKYDLDTVHWRTLN
jgi:hypothetical protein